MSIADMIPTLDDKALAVLRANAERAGAGENASRRQQAADLIPLIDAELASRLALKPVKAPPVRKKAAPKPRRAAPQAAAPAGDTP